MSAELKPCPHCGNHPAWSDNFKVVRCNYCWVRTGLGTKDECIAAWNRRTELPKVGDEFPRPAPQNEIAAFERADKLRIAAKGTNSFAWVIENGSTYWTGDGIMFSFDHMQAVRFARKQDAQRCLGGAVSRFLGHTNGVVVTEHGWTE